MVDRPVEIETKKAELSKSESSTQDIATERIQQEIYSQTEGRSSGSASETAGEASETANQEGLPGICIDPRPAEMPDAISGEASSGLSRWNELTEKTKAFKTLANALHPWDEHIDKLHPWDEHIDKLHPWDEHINKLHPWEEQTNKSHSSEKK